MLDDFKFFLLLDSTLNLQQDSCHISHRTLNLSLHYLVKYKRSTIAMLLMYVTHSICGLLSLWIILRVWYPGEMLNVPSFGRNTCPKTSVPLIHCIIDYTLSLAMPDFCRTLLQFTDVMNLMSVAYVSMRTSMPNEDIFAVRCYA